MMKANVRYRTIDSPLLGRPVRDTLLTCPTDAELAAYFKNRAKTDYGKCYTGLQSAFESMDPELRDEIYKRLDAYRADTERAASVAKRTTGPMYGKDRMYDESKGSRDGDPFMGRTSGETGAMNRQLNADARARWSKK